MNRKSIKRRTQPSPRTGWLRFVLVLCLVVGGAVFYHHRGLSHPSIAERWSGLKVWVAERRNHLQYGLSRRLDKMNSLAVKKDEEPEIHFEFYTALANMQVPVPDAAKVESSKVVQEKSVTVSRKEPSRKPVKMAITSADDIERALSEEIKK
ncbi:MAG TPA: hypothetical protein VNC84_05635 [Gammaproteobacteria bacterium]|jgi:hypothetical protein|nr:hypothetical protein [Gammaproteobacteria bacterium]